MFPVDEVHNIGENTHHTVGTCGNVLRVLVHHIIGVRALQLCNLFFRLAEAVPEPAHHEAGLECQGFVLPYIRHRVAVDPDSAFLVCSAVRCIVFILPEASAEHSRLVRPHNTYSDTAQLRVAAAYNHRRSLGQSCLFLALCGHGSGSGAAFPYFSEHVGAQSAASGNGGIPGSVFEAE